MIRTTSRVIPRLDSRQSGRREALLVLSDVHLGQDLVSASAHAPRRSAGIDRDLVALLEHYRKLPPEGERWRLVFAGDLIDFIGITIDPKDEVLSTPLSPEEVAHGLGNAPDHARIKLRRVVDRHRPVFEAIAAFVAEGHALTIVHGNHDLEFHWDLVKAELRQLLLAHAPSPPRDPDAFASRIEFNPWFFYVDGVAYIEHGHQYDALCATGLVMAPLSPLDPRRIARGFSDVLLRFVVRRTEGLREYGHEVLGILDYFAMGFRLGLRGMFKLAVRFTRAVIELFRLRRAYLSEATRALRAEHERRLALLAEATRIGKDRLRALAALQVPPVTSSIRGILASVLLDKLALGFASILALLVVAAVGARHGHFLWAGGLVLGSWSLTHRHLTRARKMDPAQDLVDRAGQLARLFPAAFVVMGHTHVPMEVPVNGGATYINVGSWAEEEPDPGATSAYRAARTHLVIRPGESGPVAEFLQWSSDEGPKRFNSG